MAPTSPPCITLPPTPPLPALPAAPPLPAAPLLPALPDIPAAPALPALPPDPSPGSTPPMGPQPAAQGSTRSRARSPARIGGSGVATRITSFWRFLLQVMGEHYRTGSRRRPGY